MTYSCIGANSHTKGKVIAFRAASCYGSVMSCCASLACANLVSLLHKAVIVKNARLNCALLADATKNGVNNIGSLSIVYEYRGTTRSTHRFTFGLTATDAFISYTSTFTRVLTI